MAISETGEPLPNRPQKKKDEAGHCEQFKPGAEGEIRTGIVHRNTLPPAVVEYEDIDGTAVFEGDIILGPSDKISVSTRAIVITGNQYRWRNGVIPYRIEPGFPNPVRVTSAIAHWQRNTSIRFVVRTKEHDFVTFRAGNGCSSPVGRQGGEQFIDLAPGCSTGNVIHEIGHTVALWHEQSREDRDNFVRINWSNIQPDQMHNFNQHISDGDDVGPYDYGSIMHYGAFDFAIDPNVPTIVASQAIGQRTALSNGDIAAVRRIYYFRRLHDSGNQAGTAREIAAVRHDGQQVLTAVRSEQGTLELISWNVSGAGAVMRTGDSGNQAGTASSIDIVRVAPGRCVTACRAANGNLLLISWSVTGSGGISRTGDSGAQAGTATLIRIVALSDSLLATACRAANGSLLLITWQLSPTGAFQRLHDSGQAAGEVREISVIDIPASSGWQIVTSVRTAKNTLMLIVWNISSSGEITRVSDSGNQAGEASMIRSARVSSGHIITAVRTAAGTLELISWAVGQGNVGVRRIADSDGQAGIIFDNALMPRAPGVVSAVRTEAGNLMLIAWEVNSAGQISRTGDSYNLAGNASLITMLQDPLSGNAPMLTAVRAEASNLFLITWTD